jgi:hypothetical protein
MGPNGGGTKGMIHFFFFLQFWGKKGRKNNDNMLGKFAGHAWEGGEMRVARMGGGGYGRGWRME